MQKSGQANSSRRQFLKTSGTLAATTAIAHSAGTRAVHAGEDHTIRVALIGCGGRGTGAAANALSVENGPIELVAMADVFEDKLKNSYHSLLGNERIRDKVKVTEETSWVSFDGYKSALDCLRPGDVAIFATPPAFRWVHFSYAVEKGLNVFMEKPVTVDGPTSLRMFELGKKAAEKNLKVGVGLMCRHCDARQELHDRIHDGEIGDINMMRSYRMAGPTGYAEVAPKPDGISELMYQIRNFHGFLWASGGAVSDFLIHNIDECCWMKDAFPVRAKACGGRHYRGDNIDQNFDSYSIEYTFADGTKLFMDGRTVPGCHQEFASYAHGSKGVAIVSTASHSPAKSRTYLGHNIDKNNLLWAYPQPERNPYQTEWNDLIAAIREDKIYNEVERGVEASLVTSMGRMAAHTGQLITRSDFLEGGHEFAPDVGQLSFDAPAPIRADANGKYSIPLPGIVSDREYA
ncbi:MAG: Gfo/Idh/MocA family oxidoreductase [Pirellulaceae bacterium]|nr:Gfo/Idh/MocA family oxidoreductase [Pirellulaceae bacterium]